MKKNRTIILIATLCLSAISIQAKNITVDENGIITYDIKNTDKWEKGKSAGVCEHGYVLSVYGKCNGSRLKDHVQCTECVNGGLDTNNYNWDGFGSAGGLDIGLFQEDNINGNCDFCAGCLGKAEENKIENPHNTGGNATGNFDQQKIKDQEATAESTLGTASGGLSFNVALNNEEIGTIVGSVQGSVELNVDLTTVIPTTIINGTILHCINNSSQNVVDFQYKPKLEDLPDIEGLLKSYGFLNTPFAIVDTSSFNTSSSFFIDNSLWRVNTAFYNDADRTIGGAYLNWDFLEDKMTDPENLEKSDSVLKMSINNRDLLQSWNGYTPDDKTGRDYEILGKDIDIAFEDFIPIVETKAEESIIVVTKAGIGLSTAFINNYTLEEISNLTTKSSILTNSVISISDELKDKLWENSSENSKNEDYFDTDGNYIEPEVKEYNVIVRDNVGANNENPSHIDNLTCYTYIKESFHDNPTKSELIMATYKALGKEFFGYRIYFVPTTQHVPIQYSPLLEKAPDLTGAIDKDRYYTEIFVTRSAKDKYWSQALADGLVTNGYVTEEYDIEETISKKKPVYRGETIERLSNAEQSKTMTIAEYCKLLYDLMYLYGEEVLTDSEQNMLLAKYGVTLPNNITPEQLKAIKYLLSQGIVETSMNWNVEIDVATMRMLLMRVVDKNSRLTFKKISIPYDENLLSLGLLPTYLADTLRESSIIDNGILKYSDEYLYFTVPQETVLKNSTGKDATTNQIIYSSSIVALDTMRKVQYNTPKISIAKDNNLNDIPDIYENTSVIYEEEKTNVGNGPEAGDSSDGTGGGNNGSGTATDDGNNNSANNTNTSSKSVPISGIKISQSLTINDNIVYPQVIYNIYGIEHMKSNSNTPWTSLWNLETGLPLNNTSIDIGVSSGDYGMVDELLEGEFKNTGIELKENEIATLMRNGVSATSSYDFELYKEETSKLNTYRVKSSELSKCALIPIAGEEYGWSVAGTSQNIILPEQIENTEGKFFFRVTTSDGYIQPNQYYVEYGGGLYSKSEDLQGMTIISSTLGIGTECIAHLEKLDIIELANKISFNKVDNLNFANEIVQKYGTDLYIAKSKDGRYLLNGDLGYYLPSSYDNLSELYNNFDSLEDFIINMAIGYNPCPVYEAIPYSETEYINYVDIERINNNDNTEENIFITPVSMLTNNYYANKKLRLLSPKEKGYSYITIYKENAKLKEWKWNNKEMPIYSGDNLNLEDIDNNVPTIINGVLSTSGSSLVVSQASNTYTLVSKLNNILELFSNYFTDEDLGKKKSNNQVAYINKDNTMLVPWSWISTKIGKGATLNKISDTWIITSEKIFTLISNDTGRVIYNNVVMDLDINKYPLIYETDNETYIDMRTLIGVLGDYVKYNNDGTTIITLKSSTTRKEVKNSYSKVSTRVMSTGVHNGNRRGVCLEDNNPYVNYIIYKNRVTIPSDNLYIFKNRGNIKDSDDTAKRELLNTLYIDNIPESIFVQHYNLNSTSINVRVNCSSCILKDGVYYYDITDTDFDMDKYLNDTSQALLPFFKNKETIYNLNRNIGEYINCGIYKEGDNYYIQDTYNDFIKISDKTIIKRNSIQSSTKSSISNIENYDITPTIISPISLCYSSLNLNEIPISNNKTIPLNTTINDLNKITKLNIIHFGEDTLKFSMSVDNNFEIVMNNAIKVGEFDSNNTVKFPKEKINKLRFVGATNSYENIIYVSDLLNGANILTLEEVRSNLNSNLEEEINDTKINKFDWKKWNIIRNLEDVDTVISILHIFILAIIPRIACFIFIAFSTACLVRDNKLIQRFCENVIDVYKVLSFGLTNYEKVNKVSIWISTGLSLATLLIIQNGEFTKILNMLFKSVIHIISR